MPPQNPPSPPPRPPQAARPPLAPFRFILKGFGCVLILLLVTVILRHNPVLGHLLLLLLVLVLDEGCMMLMYLGYVG